MNSLDPESALKRLHGDTRMVGIVATLEKWGLNSSDIDWLFHCYAKIPAEYDLLNNIEPAKKRRQRRESIVGDIRDLAEKLEADPDLKHIHVVDGKTVHTSNPFGASDLPSIGSFLDQIADFIEAKENQPPIPHFQYMEEARPKRETDNGLRNFVLLRVFQGLDQIRYGRQAPNKQAEIIASV